MAIQTSLTTPNLVDALTQELAKELLAETYKPGAQLPSEAVIGNVYGVSRSVVREALVQLKALGVIEIRQGKGAYVSEIPFELLILRLNRIEQEPEDLLVEIWEAREFLEAAVAELAALRRTDEHIAKLEDAVTRMGEAIALDEPGTEADTLFHLRLFEASNNSVVAQILDSISSLVNSSRRASLQREGRSRESHAEHKEILQAIVEQSPQRAREAMRRHIMNGRFVTTSEQDEVTKR